MATTAFMTRNAHRVKLPSSILAALSRMPSRRVSIPFWSSSRLRKRDDSANSMWWVVSHSATRRNWRQRCPRWISFMVSLIIRSCSRNWARLMCLLAVEPAISLLLIIMPISRFLKVATAAVRIAPFLSSLASTFPVRWMKYSTRCANW